MFGRKSGPPLSRPSIDLCDRNIIQADCRVAVELVPLTSNYIGLSSRCVKLILTFAFTNAKWLKTSTSLLGSECTCFRKFCQRM